ncbi:hypothetical protein B0T17DRAFT_533258 [Bombardia bombarda]|uniref:Uncharacterized protein n=1 Tax=Bombardia bombarda TaxID=252184 RepID=A0AA39WTA1_9PEZI|nr:hypothetical protein B0T17DRAFT_533258 [Bombardia bombarda]
MLPAIRIPGLAGLLNRVLLSGLFGAGFVVGVKILSRHASVCFEGLTLERVQRSKRQWSPHSVGMFTVNVIFRAPRKTRGQ